MTRNVRWRLPTALALVAAALLGCDGDQAFAPESRSTTAGRPTVNAPSGATAVAASWNQIDVAWQDNSSNESGFEVHRSTTGANGTFTVLATTGAGAAGYSNGGLSGTTQYCYQVRALKTTGNHKSYSGFSDVACATTPASPVPVAPSEAHAIPRGGAWITVKWNDNSPDETAFRVERALASAGPWSSLTTMGANTTAVNDFGFAAEEQTICYRVFATNSYGDSPASNVFCTAVPATPTNLAVTARSDNSVDLAWMDNSAVEDGYQVWRGGGVFWAVVATLPPNTTAYHDPGLVPDATYSYRVNATRDSGYSAPSNDVQVVLATTAPAPPASLAVQPQSSSSVSSQWVDQSTNEMGFRVERSTDGGASWVTATNTGVDEAFAVDYNLAAEQQVCYRAIAFNGIGESAPSSTACTTPPAGPTDLTATRVDDITVALAWTDNSAVEDGYEVWVDDGYDPPFPIASLEPNTTTFSWQDGGIYYYDYFVVAVKDGGYSDISNYAYPVIPGAGGVQTRSPSRAPLKTLAPRRRLPGRSKP